MPFFIVTIPNWGEIGHKPNLAERWCLLCPPSARGSREWFGEQPELERSTRTPADRLKIILDLLDGIWEREVQSLWRFMVLCGCLWMFMDVYGVLQIEREVQSYLGHDSAPLAIKTAIPHQKYPSTKLLSRCKCGFCTQPFMKPEGNSLYYICPTFASESTVSVGSGISVWSC